MRRMLLALAVLLAAAALFSCVSYNEDCTPLVDNPDDVVGNLAGDVDITKNRVRSGNNAVGQVVADAYRHSADDPNVRGALPPADVGVENSGSIRNEGVCQNNDVLPRGPVRRKTLRQVLPFDDTVSVVSVDVPKLKSVLEHSVAGFASASAGAAGTPAGSFLQISGVIVEADCSRPAQSATDGGDRVRRIALDDATDGGSGTVLYEADAGVVTAREVRIACNSFVLTGGDGYTMLSNLDPVAAKRLDEQGLNFQIVAQYFQKTYPDAQHALPAAAKPRWQFTNCAGAVSQ